VFLKPEIVTKVFTHNDIQKPSLLAYRSTQRIVLKQ